MKNLTTTIYLTVALLLGSGGVSFSETYQLGGEFDEFDFDKELNW